MLDLVVKAYRWMPPPVENGKKELVIELPLMVGRSLSAESFHLRIVDSWDMCGNWKDVVGDAEVPKLHCQFAYTWAGSHLDGLYS